MPQVDAPPQAAQEVSQPNSNDFMIEVDGRLVGQVNAGTIVLGSFRSFTVGYWVSRSVAGRMITPTAVALVVDHLLGAQGLHRVEVNIRPENRASLAVVRKLGFRSEGTRSAYLHIAGAWRDHLSFALTTEDLGGETMLDRLARRYPGSPLAQELRVERLRLLRAVGRSRAATIEAARYLREYPNGYAAAEARELVPGRP